MRRMIETYRELGYEIFELPPGAKAPPPTGWQRLASVTREIPPGWNHGVSTEKFAVLDFDGQAGLELAREFYRTRRNIITTLVKTPKGLHAYFSGSLHNAQKGTWDVRGVGGYVVGAGSVVAGQKYEFVDGHELVPIDQLKPFPADFIPERKEVERVPEQDHIARTIRARAWIAKVDPAIQGQGGSNTTFRVACQLFQKFGLTREEAWLLLLDFNERCVPPWSIRELEHKLNDAEKKGATSGRGT